MSGARGSLRASPVSPPIIELPPALLPRLSTGHPWVYRDHVPRGFSAPPGTWVNVRSGRFSAFALWDPDSPIALRVYSRTAVPDAALLEERVRAAISLRDATGVTGSASAYRLIAGEGDGLPGVVVDRYGPFAILLVDSRAVEPLVPGVVRALSSALRLQGIVRKIRDRPDAAGGPRLEILSGRAPPPDLIVEEHGKRFLARLHEGQKTGLFLDQRDNRRTVESLASGRRVLNLFGYTGGFSVYAARGGATSVTTVDVAEGALGDARENFRLNGLDPDAHEFACADAFAHLAEAASRREVFDLVVSDPPSFARSRAHRDRAMQAYARLHAACLAVTAPGGLYAASSCTTQVGPDAFRETLATGARKAGRRLQIVHDAGHAADHPVLAGHPEGRYLKFMVTCATPST